MPELQHVEMVEWSGCKIYCGTTVTSLSSSTIASFAGVPVGCVTAKGKLCTCIFVEVCNELNCVDHFIV